MAHDSQRRKRAGVGSFLNGNHPSLLLVQAMRKPKSHLLGTFEQEGAACEPFASPPLESRLEAARPAAFDWSERRSSFLLRLH